MKTLGVLTILLFSFGSVYADSKDTKGQAYAASVDKSGVQKIEVLGGEYYYKPDYIIVKKGVPVELIIKKEPGIIPHNIIINEPDAGMDFNESLSTKEKAIRFTPTKTGKYPFYCDKKFLFFKSHQEKGMEGIIEVVEQD